MHISTSTQDTLVLGFGDYSCNWGAHICGLYDTEDERDSIVLSFLGQGARDGDLQLYCPSERTRNDFVHRFTERFPELSAKLKDPDYFQLYHARQLYYPDGIFNPLSMARNLTNFFKVSQLRRARNIRACAEMVWALDTFVERDELMVYESWLNYFIPGKPWVSVCMYNVNKFSGSIIMNVLQTHPYSINKGVVMENPFYQPPDVWLASNAPDYYDAFKSVRGA